MDVETLNALEQAIEPYRESGYRIISQTEASITLVGQHRPFSYLGFLVGLIIFWPLAVLYLASYNHSRDTSVCLRITSEGLIEASGYTLSMAAKERRGARLRVTFIAISFLLLTAIVVALLVMRSTR